MSVRYLCRDSWCGAPAVVDHERLDLHPTRSIHGYLTHKKAPPPPRPTKGPQAEAYRRGLG